MRAWILFLIVVLPIQAEIIDRIAVTVGTNVITESMIRMQIRLAAFQDNRSPDFSPAEMRKAAESLVDQMLLFREMDDARYPEPAMADILDQIQEFQKDRFRSEEEYRRELTRRGIQEEELKRFFQHQVRSLQFIEVRFRTGVQVSLEEVTAYYEQRFKPNLLKGNSPVPPLEDVSEEIEEILVAERVDAATDDWLKQTRALAPIRFRQEVFQ